MVQVYSKEELQKAIANNEKSILVCGAYAQELKTKYQRRKKAKKEALLQVAFSQQVVWWLCHSQVVLLVLQLQLEQE